MMEHPGFFDRAGPFSVAELAARLGAELAPGVDPGRTVADIKPLGDAGPGHLTFFENRKYLPQLAATQAGGVLVASMFAPRVPAGVAALVMKQPYRGFAQALAIFYPGSLTSRVAEADQGTAQIHPAARLEEGVVVEPGAIIGKEAWIGRGTRIAAGAVIGYRVTVGRDCWIGPGTSVIHTLVGDRVILHGGVRLGQDGFGFAMGAGGHLKVPQIGRVIIQSDVEIGANTTVDRGALNDTVIGEGTKIDNLCQIGHNVRIGRHCIIVAQVAIAGSTVIGDYVVIGGMAGIAGHLTIGAGAQIAGAAVVKDDVAPRTRMVGHPAQPIRQWARERNAIRRLMKTDPGSEATDADGTETS